MIRVFSLCGESSLFLFEVAGGFSPIRLTPIRALVGKARLIVALTIHWKWQCVPRTFLWIRYMWPIQILFVRIIVFCNSEW